MLDQKSGVADPGETNSRSRWRTGKTLQFRLTRRVPAMQSLDRNRFGIFSRQPELPTQDSGKGVSRVGMDVPESRSPNPFRHDDQYPSQQGGADCASTHYSPISPIPQSVDRKLETPCKLDCCSVLQLLRCRLGCNHYRRGLEWCWEFAGLSDAVDSIAIDSMQLFPHAARW